MTYKIKCLDCQHTYLSESAHTKCPKHHGTHWGSNVIGEVLDTAVDVALAYTGVTAAVEIADAGIGFVSSFFD